MRTVTVYCDECGGDGGYSEPYAMNPFTGNISYHDTECPSCGGRGKWEEEVRPIELEDLTIMSGEEVV